MTAIAHIEAAMLEPGVLGRRFREGAAAIVIEGSPAISDLWRRLMAKPQSLPWAATLYDLSANLLPDDDLTKALGDIYYFKPGRHSYIARKIEIGQTNGGLVAQPALFRVRGEDIKLSADLIEDCWTFVSSIMTGLGPTLDRRAIPFSYRAVVQRLKYHDAYAGHEALFRMVRNSLGPWARQGYLLDRKREEMHGPFARRGVSDAVALLSLIPLFSARSRSAHASPRTSKGPDVPDGSHVIVKAHIDTRVFSALCGTRHNLQTEILTGGRWLPLPVDCENIVVLPGSGATKAYGIAPTVHRVLQDDGIPADADEPALRNVTLLLGAK